MAVRTSGYITLFIGTPVGNTCIQQGYMALKFQESVVSRGLTYLQRRDGGISDAISRQESSGETRQTAGTNTYTSDHVQMQQ